MFVKLYNAKNSTWHGLTEKQAELLVLNNPEVWRTKKMKELYDLAQEIENDPDPLHGSRRYKNNPE